MSDDRLPLVSFKLLAGDVVYVVWLREGIEAEAAGRLALEAVNVYPGQGTWDSKPDCVVFLVPEEDRIIGSRKLAALIQKAAGESWSWLRLREFYRFCGALVAWGGKDE